MQPGVPVLGRGAVGASSMLLPRTTLVVRDASEHSRRVRDLPGTATHIVHGSIRPEPIGLRQADTHAVTTALGTIWGLHGSPDPEQHARGGTFCTLFLPDMFR